ncbi:MAG: hypothetical protein ACT6RN_20990 [Agrobacterium sp.]|uniref:hypothetical protein n=1 Tax=Agrobacterium sp. TaxID=361 RepID=UPI004033567C
MSAEFWKWLFGVIASSGLMGAIAFFMRESLSKFLTKTIELRFDKKIEKFKAEMRDNEAELAEISDRILVRMLAF